MKKHYPTLILKIIEAREYFETRFFKTIQLFKRADAYKI